MRLSVALVDLESSYHLDMQVSQLGAGLAFTIYLFHRKVYFNVTLFVFVCNCLRKARSK
jgi:hypothetical protein